MKNIENRAVEWYTQRIDYLAEFMTPERRTKLEETLSSRTHYMTILTENTFHSQNASALMRHCEAFGLQELHAVESLCQFRTYTDIVRGTDKWVDLKRYDKTPAAIAELKKQGYRIVATTPHREDCTPESFDVEAGKFALVFGTEHAGISEDIIAQADEFLRIPMCGMVESLNVSASAAILIYMLSERMRHSSAEWRIDEQERLEILYRWMKSSVKDAERVLERKFGKEEE
ncbi:MAG: RNA methyltransferase [Rikenellaceae bacterium]